MLIGDRIFLRGVAINDLDFIDRLENNPENWLISGTHATFSRKNLEDYINNIQDLISDKQFRWIICLIDSDISIGAIDLFEYDPAHQRAGVGIIIEKEYRKEGYAAEAISLLNKHAFTTLNLFQLWANILDDNIASQRLFEKLNYFRTATKKRWFLKEDKWHDEHIYQLENLKFQSL